MADPTGGGSAQQPSSQPSQQSPGTIAVGGVVKQVVGAGVGRSKQTSGIWQHVVEFTPPTNDGMNVKCVVKHRVPAVNNVPERDVVCGHLMKYVRADPTKSVASGGTSGMWKHLKTVHSLTHREEIGKSPHSNEGKRRKAEVFAGSGKPGKRSKGQRSMTEHVVRPLSTVQREEQNRRYVAMCAVDARPFSMANTPAFRWWLGGFSEAYVEKPMHGITVDRHVDELCVDVRAAITAKLREQYESVKAMEWNGPWVSIQCDATSTNNSEYFTVSFSWVPPDFSGMERVAFCTKEFPGRHSANEIEPWLRQVTIDAFGDIVGAENCEPRLIYIAATVDQGANMVNAFKNMGVQTLLCSGHRLNSAVQWATGVGGSYKADGTGTCKNRQSRELTTKVTAMVGHCSHSVCNNDEFKKVQAELEEAAKLLELLRRNDTRWASLYKMYARVLRLKKPLMEYFSRNAVHRALFPLEWQAVQQLVSVLDEAAVMAAQVQGGRHGFVGQSINDFCILRHSVTAAEQDIRPLDLWDGPKTTLATSQLQPMTQTLLSVLAEDLSARDLGSAVQEPERVNLVLDPRYKSCCESVVLNGGVDFQQQVAGDVNGNFSYFLGYTVVQSEEGGIATPSLSGGGGAAAGGGVVAAGVQPLSAAGGAGAEAPSPAPGPATAATPLSRLEKFRRAQNQKIARPETTNSSSVRETRKDAGLREFGEYMKEAALPDTDPSFTALEYWKPRAVDGLDKSGKVAIPARWPHVGLVARLYAGIDATSCQAERNFSALKLVVSDLRASTSPAKVEKTLFLRLNKHLIPGLDKVLEKLDAVADERKSNKIAAVEAKNAAAGQTAASPIAVP